MPNTPENQARLRLAAFLSGPGPGRGLAARPHARAGAAGGRKLRCAKRLCRRKQRRPGRECPASEVPPQARMPRRREPAGRRERPFGGAVRFRPGRGAAGRLCAG